MSRNECNKVKKDWEKIEYKTPHTSRKIILLDMKNGNTLWDNDIDKDMTTLDRLCVFQFYLPKTKFGNKDG